MRIPSGTIDQYIYFVAVDATDLKTRETGLSSFTVYRSRNGAAAAAMTTPTVNETDVTNMPGVYELLLDEDMTIGSGNDSEEMVFHITQASMAPVTRVIELYRPKITAGETLTVTSGLASANMTQVGGQTASATGGVNFDDISTIVVDTSTDIPNILQSSGVLLSAASVDLIWDEDVDTSHQTAGTAGKKLDDAGAAADPWSTAVPGAYGAGTAGYILGTNLDVAASTLATSAALATVDTNVDAILVDTGTTLDAHLTDIKGTGFVKDTHSLIDIETYVDLIDDGTSGLAKIATDVAAILVDTGTTLDGKVNTVDTVVDAIKLVTDKFAFSVANQVDSNPLSINSVAAAAAQLAKSANQIISGTVNTSVFTPTTTAFAADDITEATADHYNGRIVIWTSGALAGQATDITDYELASGEGKFTVTALTEAPGNNDTFIIV